MNSNAIALLITLLLGLIVFVVLIPHGNREHVARELRRFRALSEAGGYVHDTAMSTYIPPTCFHPVTGTFTWTAGQVAGTIAMHRAAANQTSVISIPILLPSNAAANKGACLKSIEIDYENTVAEPTSMTWTLNKVTRGAEGAAASVSAVTKADTVAAAAAKTVDQHRQVVTLSTPAWIDNDEYFLLELSLVAGGGGTVNDLYAAVANWTLRV